MVGKRVTHVRHTLSRFVLSLRARRRNCDRGCIPCLIGRSALCNANRLPGFTNSLFRAHPLRRRTSADGCTLVPATRIPLAGLMHNRVVSRSSLPVGVATRAPYFHSRTNSCNHSAHNLVHVRRFSGIRVIRVIHPRSSVTTLRRVANRTRGILRLLNLPCHGVVLYANSVNFNTYGACSLRM